MFISTTQEFNALYFELSLEAKKPLSAQEFMAAAAQRNIFVSFLTAMFIADDLEAIKEVKASVEQKELVAA